MPLMFCWEYIKHKIQVIAKETIWVNTLRSKQNGRHLSGDIIKCIFLIENVWTSVDISLKFVPKGPISSVPALVQIMAWRCPGDKSLTEPMVVSLVTHICVSRPQWLNSIGMKLAFTWLSHLIWFMHEAFLYKRGKTEIILTAIPLNFLRTFFLICVSKNKHWKYVL